MSCAIGAAEAELKDKKPWPLENIRARSFPCLVIRPGHYVRPVWSGDGSRFFREPLLASAGQDAKHCLEIVYREGIEPRLVSRRRFFRDVWARGSGDRLNSSFSVDVRLLKAKAFRIARKYGLPCRPKNLENPSRRTTVMDAA